MKKNNLNFDLSLAKKYKSKSQISRVLSEGWASLNLICPQCLKHVTQYPANQKVADFFCASCGHDFELKSKKKSLARKTAGGDYNAMMERINSQKNPHFVILIYDNNKVKDLFFIPNFYFVDSIILKRNPTSPKGRKRPWVGCDILIKDIPEFARNYYIKDGIKNSIKQVKSKFIDDCLLIKDKNQKNKKWIMEILSIVENFKEKFSLNDVYQYEKELSLKFPKNSHVKAKIRQQIQILRDRGIVLYVERGTYIFNKA